MNFLKRSMLPLVVFITGACVLVIEVVAVRILAPYFGNTMFTFSSVISVILAALSIGYFVGGRLADRKPSEALFFSIIFISGIGVLLLHALAKLALPTLGSTLSLVSGPLISSLILFLIPALLLGTLSPFAVRLQQDRLAVGTGTVAGGIFFWSTLGSILGSLGAGFVLIPHLGLDRIIISVGIVLVALGLLPLLARRIALARAAALVIVSAAGIAAAILVPEEQAQGLVYQQDGIYERLSVVDQNVQGRKARVFKQDRSISGGMFLDSPEMLSPYTRYYALYRLFNPDIRRALVIGGGVYTVPKALLAEKPGITVDVAEIEPSLLTLAQRYFEVPGDSHMVNFIEDGRRLLAGSETPYDFIFSDVYYSLFSIPAHFTTREFFATARSKLATEGVFVANIIGSLSRARPSLVLSIIRTFREAFPNSYFFAVDGQSPTRVQNIMLVGYNSERKVNLRKLDAAALADPFLSSLRDKQINLARWNLNEYQVLEDNHAPVEYLTARMVARATRKPEPGFAVSGEEMLALIRQQLAFGPRHLSAPGHPRTQSFIRAELEALADDVKLMRWTYTPREGKPQELANIIGRYAPENPVRVLVGTHYDSKRYADKDTDDAETPVPGANDSASGVAVLLELARILGANPDKLHVGVDLVFFDGEEGDEQVRSDYTRWQPMGSIVFANNLHKLYTNDKPRLGLVLDMVCDADLKIFPERTSNAAAPKLVRHFWKHAHQRFPEVFGTQIGPAIRDDHSALIAAGIPSLLLIDFEYPWFHTREDTLDKCSAGSLKKVGQTVIEYLYGLKA